MKSSSLSVFKTIGTALLAGAAVFSGTLSPALAQDEDLSRITKITLKGGNFTQLSIEGGEKLQILTCANNQLDTLNVSGCAKLTDLTFSGNPLRVLNVSNCTSLGSLDLSTCAALRELRCSGNAWQTLDISGCTELELLDCSDNQLTSLDVKNHDALKTLNCSENSLSDLDVSGCKALSSLNYSSVRTLNASGCTSLRSLEIQKLGVLLTTLDVSGCTSLISLWLDKSLKLKTLNASGCTSLENFMFNSQNYKFWTTLNLSGCTSLKRLLLPPLSALTTLDVSGCTSLSRLDVSSGVPLLEDLNVSGTALSSLSLTGYSSLKKLDVSDCPALSALNCSGNKLTTLNVSRCAVMTELRCVNNQLDSLNVSGCTSLIDLSCWNNRLKRLDVSTCKDLNYLYCENNQLDSLNVSGCTKLNSLSCENNQLTSLDVSDCIALMVLGCENNQLNSLDVTGCEHLNYLWCRKNQLTTLNVSGCTELVELRCFKNKLTSLDVTHNANLQYLDCGGNRLRSLDLSGNKMCQEVWCDSNHVPLSSFYPLMARRTTESNYRLSPQSDTVQLAGGEVFDVSGEMAFGTPATKTNWSVQNLDGAVVADGTFEENDGLFRFLKQGDYRLVLQNDEVRQQYLNEEDRTIDNSAVVFTWVVKVLSDAAYQITVQANNAAWGRVSGGGGSFPAGQLIEIVALAEPGYRFVKWVHTADPNKVFSTDATHPFNVSEELSLTAVFELIPTYTISVQANRTAWGRVSISGTGPYQENTNVSIAASTQKGYNFVKWVHSGTENVFTTKKDTTFKATQDLNLTAVFAEIVYDITLQSNNAAYGEVSRDGRYREDSVVVIDATPKAGYHFVKWVHTGTSNVFTRVKRHTFKATQHLALTAVFEDTIGKLRVEAVPNSAMMGETFITGDGIYKHGDTIILTAKAKIGYRFTNWKRVVGEERAFFADSTKKDTTFVVTESMNLVAYFRNVPPHDIIVKSNNDAWGKASGGGPSIPENAEVTIGATPKQGYRFVNWTHLVYNGNSLPDEEVFGTSADTTFEAVQNLTLTANFELIPIVTYTIELISNNADYGEVSGFGTYKENDPVTIAATPKAGYRFIAWKKGEEVFSLDAIKTFPATENLSLTAYFEEVPLLNVTLSVNDSTWGRVTGEGLYRENAEVKIKATPKEGYKFVNWKKGEVVFSLSADTAFRITEDMSLRATFDSLPETDPVTPPGTGEKITIVLRSNDNALGRAMFINGADTAVYKEGAEVTIMAEPMGEKNYFVNWVRVKADGSEEEFSANPTYTFKATENMVLTAYFDSETCEAYPYVKNRVIYLSKPMGHVQIYNLHGQLLYEGRSIAFAVPAKGMYILYVTDCRKKIKVMVP